MSFKRNSLVNIADDAIKRGSQGIKTDNEFNDGDANGEPQLEQIIPNVVSIELAFVEDVHGIRSVGVTTTDINGDRKKLTGDFFVISKENVSSYDTKIDSDSGLMTFDFGELGSVSVIEEITETGIRIQAQN